MAEIWGCGSSMSAAFTRAFMVAALIKQLFDSCFSLAHLSTLKYNIIHC